MKLSKRYDAITGQHIIGGEIVRKNVTPEVAKLEDAVIEAYIQGAIDYCRRESLVREDIDVPDNLLADTQEPE